MKAPPNVRSLVLREVNLTGGGGEDKLLTVAGSPLAAVKLSPALLLSPEELGNLGASPESDIYGKNDFSQTIIKTL